MIIDWDNLTQDEYQELVAARHKLENDLSTLITWFSQHYGLEVTKLNVYNSNSVQAFVPMRVLFFGDEPPGVG